MPKPLWKQLLDASQVGLNLVISTFIGGLIGYFVDRHFHTIPWFTLLFFFAGMTAGFREVLRYIRRKDEEEEKGKGKKHGKKGL